MNSDKIKKGNYVIHDGEPYIVKDFSISDTIQITLQSLFSDKTKEITISPEEILPEADITRKCASVLFKKKGKLEIMDSYDFSVHSVKVDKEVFNNSIEGDKVTYIKQGKAVKILELRKN